MCLGTESLVRARTSALTNPRLRLKMLLKVTFNINDDHAEEASSPGATVAVHLEDALTLAGCAIARHAFPDLGLSDPAAEDILAKLDLDPARFDERKLWAATLRTKVIDALVREFFERHPTGLAVGLLSGLCTRFSRVDNGVLRWLDLEQAAIAAFKKELFVPSERHMISQCCSIACSGWMELLADAADGPVLLVAQGAFRRTPVDVRDQFFTNASVHLPAGTELVIEHDASAPLRPSSVIDGPIGERVLDERVALSTLDPSGAWAIYPRIRFVRASEHPDRLEGELTGFNAISRLFRGRRTDSAAVAHLRFT